jgi:hypothetical protein
LLGAGALDLFATMKKMFLISFVATLLLSSCMFLSKTVDVVLNPHSSGWYFIKAIRNPALKDYGTITLNFDDTTRFKQVSINHMDKTVFSPVDRDGVDLSPRLQFPGIKPVNDSVNFFVFYNPTDVELAEVKKWNPTDEVASKILSDLDTELSKYYKPAPIKELNKLK